MTSRPPPVVALLTDFGLSDAYAGVMKGVILGGAPYARIVDLTHAVLPQAVNQAAFLLETAWRYFPPGSIFLVVVDPGVGSSRRRLAVEAEGMTFVGADNGCLSGALSDHLRGPREVGRPYQARPVRLDAAVRAVSIENQALFRKPVSATFEGRDVFAPVVTFLANGGGVEEMGPRIDELLAFPSFRAPEDDGRLNGLIVHIDTYGNLITDIRAGEAQEGMLFRIHGRDVPLVRTYASAREPSLVAVVGSSGFVEIAWPNGSAASVLDPSVGDTIEASARES